MLPINDLFGEIRELILIARKNAAVAVNSELVLLYWDIGNVINQEVLNKQKPEYGKSVIRNLSRQLTLEFGKGFNPVNLWLFVKFSSVFNEKEKVYALRKLFSWTHFKIFISLKDSLERQFYMEMCKLERWSTRQLKERIDSALYLRTAISKKPEL